MLDRLIVVDSVTRLGPEAQGRVVIAGSHGGRYAAWLAARARAAAVLLNDAGVGLDGAGIAGVMELAELGIPAASLSHRSCRIGDGYDMLGRGIVSHANAPAVALGVAPGMPCRDAARRLARAPLPAGTLPDGVERRFPIELPGTRRARASALDSAALLGPEDHGAIVVTGSHGALLGGRPDSAARHPVFAAFYNDADGGADGAGYSRLPALEAQGIAGATYSAWTAQIGDGRAGYERGIVTCLNARGSALGGRIGMSVRELVLRFAEAAEKVSGRE